MASLISKCMGGGAAEYMCWRWFMGVMYGEQAWGMMAGTSESRKHTVTIFAELSRIFNTILYYFLNSVNQFVFLF